MFSNSKQIDINGTKFTIPEGFHENGLNEDGDVIITNGTVDLYISSTKKGDVEYNVNEYKKYMDNKNISTSVSNLTINNIPISKSSFDNGGGYNRYWFSNNKHVYCIHSWVKIPDMDNIVIELTKSVKNQKSN